MRLKKDVRGNDFLLQLGMHALVQRILVWPCVVPGPAVIAAFLYAGCIVGNKVVAKPVPLLYAGPHVASLWVEGQGNGVAKARCVNSLVLAVRSVFHDYRAAVVQFCIE